MISKRERVERALTACLLHPYADAELIREILRKFPPKVFRNKESRLIAQWVQQKLAEGDTAYLLLDRLPLELGDKVSARQWRARVDNLTTPQVWPTFAQELERIIYREELHRGLLQAERAIEEENNEEAERRLAQLQALLKQRKDVRSDLLSTNESLTFPTEAYTGIAGDFSDLYSQFTEAPRAFYFLAFLTAMGVLVSSQVTLQSEIQPQPRLYTVLLGESADTRKSTAIKLTVEFFQQHVPNFVASWGVGSAEGLAKLFADNPSLLLIQDEFKTFVAKAKIEGSTLLTAVNSLFEANQYSNATKRAKIEIANAHLSLLAASTVETYSAMFDSSFLDIGFLNRLFLVLDSPKVRHALPPRIPLEAKRELAYRLGNLLGEVEARAAEAGGRLSLILADEARQIWNEWYERLERSIFSKRLDTYGHRLMILLSLSNSEFTVTVETVQRVISLLNWQLEVRRMADPVDADNTVAKLEEKIRRALTRGPMTKRELKRRIHYERYGLWLFNTALENLRQAGEVIWNPHQQLYQVPDLGSNSETEPGGG